MKSNIILPIILSMLFLTFGYATLSAQQASEKCMDKILWMSLDDAFQKTKIQKRKVLIELYIDHCSWCKKMENETFSQDYIAQYINENYYPVRFDAQSKADITFKGKTYKYIAESNKQGYHQLAAELMRGKMGYPTIVFLDEEMNIIQPIQGYKDPEIFEAIITYFGQNNHKKMPWNNFKKNYKPFRPKVNALIPTKE